MARSKMVREAQKSYLIKKAGQVFNIPAISILGSIINHVTLGHHSIYVFDI